jgi:hypothetical protein
VVVCLNCHAVLTARQGDTDAFPRRDRTNGPEAWRVANRNLVEVFKLASELHLGPDDPWAQRMDCLTAGFDDVFKVLQRGEDTVTSKN